jgi:RNA polymerase sigma-70 factor (ECF subfamily)
VTDSDCRKDLYQNILIRLWKGLDSFAGHSSLRTWVYRICVNTSIDYLRTRTIKKSGKFVRLDDWEISDASVNPENQLLVSEETTLMYNCINQLTFVDKTLISLYLEDLSYREIADIVGITPQNISVKIHRIKKYLKSCLKDA